MSKNLKNNIKVSNSIEYNNGISIQTGIGSPEGVVTAPLGSQYIDSASGKNYNKKSGTGNTGWVENTTTTTTNNEDGKKLANYYSLQYEKRTIEDYIASITNWTTVATEFQLTVAITNGQNVRLSSNITLTTTLLISNAYLIDLNGFTISSTQAVKIIDIRNEGYLFCSKNTGSIVHKKTTNTSVETAITVLTQVGKYARIFNINIEHVEFGMSLSGSYIVFNNTFKYNTVDGTVNNQHRHITVGSILSDSYIDNNKYYCIAPNGTTRLTDFFTANITSWSGVLHIRNNTHIEETGKELRQAFNFESIANTITKAKLVISDNTFNDYNGGIFFLTANVLNCFEYITLTNNTQGSNGQGSFKGLMYFSFTGALGTVGKIYHYGNKTNAGALRSDYTSLIPISDTTNYNIIARQNVVTILAGQQFAILSDSDILNLFYQSNINAYQISKLLSLKQDSYSTALQTENKNVIGGINELVGRLNLLGSAAYRSVDTANGVAGLDADSKINSDYLKFGIKVFDTYTNIEPTGVENTLYLIMDTSLIYWWNSTAQVYQVVGGGFSGDYNDLTNKPTLSTVATSGSYNDLTNKPTIPQAQVNSDWSATSGVAQILNKPSLFSGSYNDLTNKPTLFDGNYNNLTNTPSLGTVASKNVGNSIGNILENGSSISSDSILETDSSNKVKSVAKNTAFNKNFGNTSNTVAQGNDGRLGTKNIDETNIGNNRIQVYNFTTGNLEYQDKEKNVKQWYVSGGVNGTGNDANNGYSQNSAFLTIAGALTKLGNTGEQLILLPGQLTESATFSALNVQINGTTSRAISGTSGTFTSNNSASGSQTYRDLTLGNFTRAGLGNVYLDNMQISGTVQDTVDGYFSVTNGNVGSINITGSGIKVFNGVDITNLTVNNASASVYINGQNKQISGSITLTNGTLSLDDVTILCDTGSTFTIGAVGGNTCNLICSNVRFVDRTTGLAAKIETKSNIQYSFNNCEYDGLSILGGTDISSTRIKKFNNAQIKTLNLSSATASRVAGVDASKNVISLDTATYPSLAELGYVKGVTSAIQTQLNGKEATITTLPVSKGGTNSGTALSNNKVIISNGNAIVESSITTTELQTLATGSTLSKLASNVVTSSDSGKIPQVDGSGNIAFIIPGSGGNVSATGLTGIPIGDIALFNLSNGTGITKVDGTATQRAVATNSLQIPARFTNAELNAGTFSTGAIHLNSDYGYLAEKGASSWSNILSSPQSISTTGQTISNKARVVEITPTAELASFITYLPDPSSMLNTVLHIKLAKTLSRLYYGTTLTPTTGTVDGSSSFALSGPHDFVTLQAVSGDWKVINKPTGFLKIGSVTTTGMATGSQCNFDYVFPLKYSFFDVIFNNDVGTSSGSYTNSIKFRINGANDAETGNYICGTHWIGTSFQGDYSPALGNQLGGSGSFFNYAGTNKNSSTIMMRITNPRLSKNKSLSISGSYLSNNVPYNVIGSGLNLSSSSFDGICYIQNGGSNATTTIEVWAI